MTRELPIPRRFILAMRLATLALAALAAVLAADPGAPAFAGAAKPPAGTTLAGWLHTVYGDGPPSAGHLHTHLLVDDTGRAIQVAVPDDVIASAGGRRAVNGRRVTVSGERVLTSDAAGAPGPALLAVHALALESPQALDAPSSLAQGVTGSQKWVSILCRFADSAGVTPYPKSWFETLLLGSDAAPGLDHYWRTASFGNINLTGSAVVGWYTLPQPRSYYVYGNPAQLDHQRAANDCTGVADADVFFPSFAGINLMFNADLDCCAWGGSTTLNRDGQVRTYRITWLPPWGYESQGPVAHEMGHGFGLPHSSGPYLATYDSRWDVMSDIWGNCPPYDPTYGCVGTHTISYHKDLLGWIPIDRRYVAARGTTQTIAIEPLDRLAASGYMMAVIPIPGSTTKFYTVETRRLAGYDSPLPGHAVIIHRVDTTASDRDARVVDPDANGNPDDSGAMWLPGEGLVDLLNNITVSVVGSTTDGFLVTVASGSAGSPPDITASPLAVSFGTVAVNTVAKRTVTLRNDGGADLVLGTITLGGANPTHFLIPRLKDFCSGRTLAPGQSCTLKVKFKPLSGGAKTATLVIPSNDPDENPLSVALDGTGSSAAALPDITVTPQPVSFGTIPRWFPSVRTVTVTNDGMTDLVLGTATLVANTGEMTRPASMDLCSGITLGPGQSCTIRVMIVPMWPGLKTGTLSIPSNDPDEGVVAVSITATAS